MLRILKAKEENLKDITILNRQFHIGLPNFYWDDESWIIKEIEKGNYFVLTENNVLIGALGIEKSEKEYSISTIAVKKDMHGKKLGKKLIDYAKGLAIKNNIPLLTVESFCEYKLEGFYTKCGFTLEKKLGKYKSHNYYKFYMKL